MPKPFAPGPGSQLAILGRFAWRLRAFVRHPSDAAACRDRTAAGLRARAANLLHAIEAGILAQPESPYRHLFRHAGIEFGDVRHAVETTGVEASLATLADAGVFLRPDEFKGRRPIERGSLRLEGRRTTSTPRWPTVTSAARPAARAARRAAPASTSTSTATPRTPPTTCIG